MIYNLSRYAYTNNDFYESIAHFASSDAIDEILQKHNCKNVPISHSGIYTYLHDSTVLPAQGWKIHVSATDQNAMCILEICASYLMQRSIPFKVIKNVKTYRLLSQKPFSRAQYGKFITIYPSSAQQCLEILEELSVTLQEFEGPRILTDRRYKECKVLYYRYGGINPLCRYDNQGVMHTYITNGLGNLVEDVRQPFYSLPEGIEDILEDEVRASESYFFSEYDVERAIRFTNAGGAYIAIRKKTGEKVLIKEARPHTFLDGFGNDAVYFRERESELLRELSDSGFVPKVIDTFFEQEHFFLVEEYIDGQTLFHINMESNPLMRLEPENKVSDYLLRIIGFAEKLCTFLAILHEKGYVLHDLTADNIMVTEDDQIKIIDLEGCLPIEQREKYLGKTIYDTMLNCDYADICELGVLLFSCLIKKEDLLELNEKTVDVFLKHLQKYYTLPSTLVDLLLTLANSTHQPSIDEILNDLANIRKQILGGAVRQKQSFEAEGDIDYQHLISSNIAATLKLHKKVNSFLFPVTPVVDNEFNISNGFIGIARALNLLGCDELNTEAAAMCKNIAENTPSGLYVGSAGCVWALLEQGSIELAKQVYHERCFSLDDGLDFSLYSGKAGIGLVSLMMWYKTGEQKYLLDAEECGNQIMTIYSPDSNQHVGYKAGNAGISLFLLHLSLANHNTQPIEFGLKLLEKDISQHKMQEGSTQVYFPSTVAGHASYPYFMEGTAGVLCVLLRYYAVLKYARLREMSIKLADGLHFAYTTSATMFYGMAGVGNALLDCAYYLKDDKYLQWAIEAVEGCARHIIEHKDYGLVYPDVNNRKISVDYGNGGLGITMFLERYTKNTLSNSALPLDDHLGAAINQLKDSLIVT